MAAQLLRSFWDISDAEYADLMTQAEGNDLASFMLKSALDFLGRDLQVASNVSLDYIDFVEPFFGPLITDSD